MPSPGDAPAPDVVVRLADGTAVAADVVGDPGGVPLVWLHGTPGSRLARHPDESLAGRHGARLIAVDRPGYGASDPQPPGAFPGALAALLDHLDVERCTVVAWSGGALDGLAAAARLGDRVAALVLVSALVPREAYAEPTVAAAVPDRAHLLELADSLPAGELGPAVAPLLAPYPCDRGLAAEHQAASRDAVGVDEVASVPGLADRMADSLVEAVRRGLAGVEADVEAQNRPSPVALADIACPVHLWWGALDTVTPVPFGDWYARHLRSATLAVVPTAGHHLPITHWPLLLKAFART